MSRPELLERIERRRQELEAAILTRIKNDDGPVEAVDPEYAEGLSAAVPVACEYCLEAIERGEANPPPIPTALRAQARVAARNGIALDVVLHRYFAGYRLLEDFLIDEVATTGLRRAADLQHLLRLLAASFERLLAAVSEEYRRESSVRSRSAEQRRFELVERLLAGEPLEGMELDYDLAGCHLALIAKGPGAGTLLRDLVASLECRALHLEREEGAVWTWLGTRTPLSPDELLRRIEPAWPPTVFLATGEPSEGLSGWRLSHRQARAALPIAVQGPRWMVRYAEVALLAAALQDETLATSLRKAYLEPLARERDGGQAMRDTLRAYLSAQGNLSSTAAALGIRRQTVSARLHVVEALLGRNVHRCTAEIELALDLAELTEQPVK